MNSRRILSLWGPVLLYAAALYAGSSQSQLPPVFDRVWDKALHAGAWVGITLLALRACHGGKGPMRVLPTVVAAALALAYGISDELHQSVVPGRDESLLDFLADAVGTAIAVGAVALAYAVRRRLTRNRALSP